MNTASNKTITSFVSLIWIVSRVNLTLLISWQLLYMFKELPNVSQQKEHVNIEIKFLFGTNVESYLFIIKTNLNKITLQDSLVSKYQHIVINIYNINTAVGCRHNTKREILSDVKQTQQGSYHSLVPTSGHN